MNLNNILNQLYMQRNHIIQNNKHDDNYEFQLNYIEKQILEYEKEINNSNNCHNLYRYEGPVYEYNKLIDNSYICNTYAISKKQALNNIRYQIKKNLGKEINSNINIDIKFLTILE